MLTALGATSLSVLLLILVAPSGLGGVQMVRQSVFILLLAMSIRIQVNVTAGLAYRVNQRIGMVRRGTSGSERSLQVVRVRRRRSHRLVRFPV